VRTYKSPDGRTVINYSSDLSGDVRIVRYDREMDGDERQRVEVWVPGGHLVEVVAAMVRAERVSEIEQMGALELLGL